MSSGLRLDSARPPPDNGAMASPEPPPDHRSGFIAVLGRPNVGKSTLLNALLGQSIAPVSPRPQTTRRRQLGIYTRQEAQAIFVDTPGLHTPLNQLGEWMNSEALAALGDADVLLCIFDASQDPAVDDQALAARVRDLSSRPPCLAALNKIDLLGPAALPARFAAFEALLPEASLLPVSAVTGSNLDRLLSALIEALPTGPRYYPEETITETYERDLAADLIRAALMHLLRDEVPYSVAVRIDEYLERGEQGAYIAATLFVERTSQKGIVIGKGGWMLKQIGTLARKEIEAMSGRKIFLELRVKELPGWRDDPAQLERFGYSSHQANDG
jgi:GTP-binding protein Era